MAANGRALRYSAYLLALLTGAGLLAGVIPAQSGHWCRHDLYRVLRISLSWPERQP
ncbi:hypothetical protein [Pseudomonas sp. BN411]|uniref:hypothetical protein n=1 Tax=Pseudomonas sp. BN411 TaxID=2567887 RepID=UPI002455768C|nr:hypothetical protein [Pseudomonas sp. BN411]